MLIDRLGGAETNKTLVHTTSTNAASIFARGFILSSAPVRRSKRLSVESTSRRVLMLVNKGNTTVTVSVANATGNVRFSGYTWSHTSTALT